MLSNSPVDVERITMSGLDLAIERVRAAGAGPVKITLTATDWRDLRDLLIASGCNSGSIAPRDDGAVGDFLGLPVYIGAVSAVDWTAR